MALPVRCSGCNRGELDWESQRPHKKAVIGTNLQSSHCWSGGRRISGACRSAAFEEPMSFRVQGETRSLKIKWRTMLVDLWPPQVLVHVHTCIPPLSQQQNGMQLKQWWRTHTLDMLILVYPLLRWLSDSSGHLRLLPTFFLRPSMINWSLAIHAFRWLLYDIGSSLQWVVPDLCSKHCW